VWRSSATLSQHRPPRAKSAPVQTRIVRLAAVSRHPHTRNDQPGEYHSTVRKRLRKAKNLGAGEGRDFSWPGDFKTSAFNRSATLPRSRRRLSVCPGPHARAAVRVRCARHCRSPARRCGRAPVWHSWREAARIDIHANLQDGRTRTYQCRKWRRQHTSTSITAEVKSFLDFGSAQQSHDVSRRRGGTAGGNELPDGSTRSRHDDLGRTSRVRCGSWMANICDAQLARSPLRTRSNVRAAWA
jgi:hypothetical protein